MSSGAIMDRRRFITGLAGIFAAGYAPAVLPSGVIMPVRKLWTPALPGGMAMMMAQHERYVVSMIIRNAGVAANVISVRTGDGLAMLNTTLQTGETLTYDANLGLWTKT